VKQKLVVIGAGGHGRELADVVVACIEAGEDLELVGYVDDAEALQGKTIHDVPVLGMLAWLKANAADVVAVLAIGIPAIRSEVLSRLHGVKFRTLVHPKAVMTKWVTLGEGVVVTAGVVMSNDIEIGAHTHVNRCATIGHDVRIGKCVHVSPGAVLSGNVTIGDECEIGAGAVLLPGVTVGARTIVGAGAAVTKDLPSGVTAVGVPAKALLAR
jgi:sugar O-acyltransferase (sialic acid O-acetyltransferase NeuD family)